MAPELAASGMKSGCAGPSIRPIRLTPGIAAGGARLAPTVSPAGRFCG